VLLCHSNRSTKVQHYELYTLPANAAAGTKAVTVFDEQTLPPGVKRAFSAVCPGAPAAWRTAVPPDEEASGSADAC
jgi:hypothetical protein